jgi:hypothetical protein
MVGAVAYVYFNKAKLIQAFTTQINKQLVARIDVADIDLSLRKFPSIAIAFSQTTCFEPLPHATDTLFSIEKIFFQFSLWDVMRGRYDLKRLSLENGNLNLRTLPNGAPNYIIWKQDSDKSLELALELQEVVLRGVRVRWENAEQIVSGDLDRMELSGKFQSIASNLKLMIAGRLTGLSFPGSTPVIAQLPLQATIRIEILDDGLRFSDGALNLPGGLIHLDGFYADNIKRLHAKGNPVRLAEIIRDWPEAWVGAFQYYGIQGNASFDLTYEQNDQLPANISCDFDFREGAASFPDQMVKAENISFKGRFFDNGKENKLQFTDLNMAFAGLSVKGQGSLLDQNKPRVQLDLSIDGDLVQLTQFLPMEMQTIAMKGQVNGTVNFKSHATTMDRLLEDAFKNALLEGNVAVSDGVLKWPEAQLEMKKIAGNATFSGKDLFLRQLHFETPKSDLQITGIGKNFFAIFGNAPAQTSWEFALNSNKLNANELMGVTFPTSENNNQSEKRDSHKWKVAVDANQLFYDDILATNFLAVLEGDESGFMGKNISFKGFGGTVQSDFLVKTLAYGSLISGNTKLIDVDIRQLFSEFDNFGQDILTSHHLQGRGTSEISWRMNLDNNAEVLLPSLAVTANLTILDGRLQKFSPMENLSKFAEVQELQDVRFEKLSNQITISEETIYIPEMDIRSNLFDLSIMGTHTFENKIDYSIKIKQRDIVAAKRKGRDLDNWIVEAGSNNEAYLWVRMTGTVDAPQFGLNTEKNKEALREGWKQQGRELRDQTRKDKSNQQTKGYQFEWDDD